MYTVQCKLCTLYNVKCTLYNVKCTLYTVNCTMYSDVRTQTYLLNKAKGKTTKLNIIRLLKCFLSNFQFCEPRCILFFNLDNLSITHKAHTVNNILHIDIIQFFAYCTVKFCILDRKSLHIVL